MFYLKEVQYKMRICD